MKVLYATDGLPPAEDAGRLLEALADPAKVEVTALCVAERLVAGVEGARAGAREIAKSAASRLSAAGFASRAETAEGRTGSAIVAAAERGAHDLVVVGAGSKSWLGNLALGSVSTRLLHAARCSVLVAHAAPRPDGARRVLVGTDGSQEAAHAVDVLAGFADPLRCEVTVLAVGEYLIPTLLDPSGAHALSGPTREIEAGILDVAREAAEAEADRLLGAGFPTRARALLGHPVRRLLEAAGELSADLVVVGSRGLDLLDRALLGSVSDRVARHSRAALVGRRAG